MRRSSTAVTYASLADECFNGSPVARGAVDATIALGCFGFATSYLIVIGGLMPQVAEMLCGSTPRICGAAAPLLQSRQLWITALGGGVGLPLMCASSLDALRFSSVVGNLGAVFIVLVTCAFALGLLPLPHAPLAPVSYEPTLRPPYTSVAGMVECVSIFFFAFSCAQNLPSLAHELRDATPRRLAAMVAAGIAISALMYQLTAWCGATAFGASVDANLLRSFPVHGGALVGAVGTVARVAVVLNVGGGFPLNMHPARTSLSGLFFGRPPSELDRRRWAALTGGLFFASWLLAVAIESLDTAMAFIGGTTALAMNFLFPAAFYIVLHSPRRSSAPMMSAAEESAYTLFESHSKEAPRATSTATLRGAQALVVMVVVMMPVIVGLAVWKLLRSGEA